MVHILIALAVLAPETNKPNQQCYLRAPNTFLQVKDDTPETIVNIFPGTPAGQPVVVKSAESPVMSRYGPQPVRYAQPVFSQPVYSQPISIQPNFGQPMYGQPMFAQPSFGGGFQSGGICFPGGS